MAKNTQKIAKRIKYKVWDVLVQALAYVQEK